jgi:hypothetical protein
MPEQFVRAVDQINLQGATPSKNGGGIISRTVLQPSSADVLIGNHSWRSTVAPSAASRVGRGVSGWYVARVPRVGCFEEAYLACFAITLAAIFLYVAAGIIPLLVSSFFAL